MNNTAKFTDQEWEELASLLSGEISERSDLLERFMADDRADTGKQWKELAELRSEDEVDVDRAWQKVNSRIGENDHGKESKPGRIRILRNNFLRVAAVALMVLALGVSVIYLRNTGVFSTTTTYVTSADQKKMDLLLPDGSRVWLNRNSRLSYARDYGRQIRNIELTGEAYFEITPDASKPFVIDAGDAMVKVVGTTFNVITSNGDSKVEVFVTSGSVMLSANSESASILIDPGYVATLTEKRPEKVMNENPNYLSWKTGMLVYDGQKLDVVFNDLKRAYNMHIVADDPSILDFTWTTAPIDNQPEETIISLICISFNLGYTKDGEVYHLSKK